ncbi:D-alanyl-D-alanine carboxypeptidase family protein [Xanthobacter sp. KR7-225]|uniref:D-alanyl-D-alanine carboxypeptidase family protein n=1 Tax=Xanthobacter sp. KR7-225 TaxID=3156613 RepID=UPI0032B55395
MAADAPHIAGVRPRGAGLVSRLAAALGLCAALAAGVGPAAAADGAFQSNAPAAILVDYETGSVLYEKEADRPVAPASLAKVMTAAVVFESLRAGKIKLDTDFFVSPDAWRRGGGPSGGAAMFAEVNKPVPVNDLLTGALAISGNDAALTLAEGVGGSESVFVRLMNEAAQKLGMRNSVFRNATGFADAAQVATARDLATLARHVIRTYPDYYPIFARPGIDWNKIRQRNRNPFLEAGIGADGLQVGWLKEVGYNGLVSAVGGAHRQRLIVVVLGAKTEKERLDEAKRLLDWGFQSFQQRALFSAGAEVARAKVFGGAASSVGLAARGPVFVLASRVSTERVVARVTYKGPLVAPVVKDTQVATLTISRGPAKVLEVPLYTTSDVPVGSLASRALDGALTLAGDGLRDVVGKVLAKLN